MSEVPEFSAEVAGLLVEATGIYLDLTSDLALFLEEESPLDEVEIIKVVRRIGIEMAGRIARVNRLIDEGRIRGTLNVEANYDPRTVQPVLRILGDSFTLLISANNRQELKALPLIAPDMLRRALWHEQIYAWIARAATKEGLTHLGLYSSEKPASQIARAS
jgi:hypothetical protein